MISVASAEQLINSNVSQLGNEYVHYTDLLGRYLAEDLLAKRPSPPFDRVTMDGIAICSADWDTQDQDPEFILQGTQYAGEAALTLKPGHCIEIMTGAVLPHNADCVIPVEKITPTQSGFSIHSDYIESGKLRPGNNIHPQGSDHASSEILVFANTKLNATHIACLVSAGHTEVRVKCSPKITIIMTGNELVEPGSELADYEIYASNAPAIENLLKTHAYHTINSVLVKDDNQALQNTISDALVNSDIVITTGGVSMGKKDMLPDTLEKLEVKCLFHKVSQKPGKPMWFGVHEKNQHKTIVFALPGNPVSALITTRRYILPAILEMQGNREIKHSVQLNQNVIFKPEKTNFMPVKIENHNGILKAQTLPFNTSGDTVGLSYSDGFVELNAQQSEFMQGELVNFFPWQN